MSDKQEIIANGEAARALVTNSAFQLALEDTHAALLDAIVQTAPPDAATREFLYTMIRIMPILRGVLQTRINAGAITAAEIAEEIAKHERSVQRAARQTSADVRQKRAPKRPRR